LTKLKFFLILYYHSRKLDMSDKPSYASVLLMSEAQHAIQSLYLLNYMNWQCLRKKNLNKRKSIRLLFFSRVLPFIRKFRFVFLRNIEIGNT
jgi:hypothetical protein